ncbi:MAG: hypothetical protein QXR87_05240 [Candidatus Hadarchaeales archaeon]
MRDARDFQNFVEELKASSIIPEELKPYLTTYGVKFLVDNYRTSVGRGCCEEEPFSEEYQRKALEKLVEGLRKAKKEGDELFSVLKDEIQSGYEEFDFRPYGYRFSRGYRPSDLELLGEENKEKLFELLKKKGYVKVSKWVWRKWEIKPEAVQFWEKYFEGKVVEQFYPVYVGFQLLLRTNPRYRDYEGFDLVDCWVALDFYNKFADKKVVSDSFWDWLKRRLPRYEDQIRELGLDYERVIKALSLPKPEGELKR